MNNFVIVLIAFGVVLGIAGVLGLVLALADKFLKVEEDPRVEEVTKMLAGANCGGCGYPGCSGLANALVNKEATSLSVCRPTKPDNKAKIKDYLASTPGPNGETVEIKL